MPQKKKPATEGKSGLEERLKDSVGAVIMVPQLPLLRSKM